MVLCSGGLLTSLPELSLAGVHRRGVHGAMGDGLTCGRIEFARLRMTLAWGTRHGRGGPVAQLAVDVDQLAATGRGVARRGVRIAIGTAAATGPGKTILGGLAVLGDRRAGVRSHVVDSPFWTRSRIGPDHDVTEVTAGPRSGTWWPGWSRPGPGKRGMRRCCW